MSGPAKFKPRRGSQKQVVRHLLMAAPNFDEPPDLRTRIQSAVPALDIVDAGAVPDHCIDCVIADDHTTIDWAAFPNLSLVLSVSLGVDNLLASGLPPHVPVARLLTSEHQWLMREYVTDHVLRSQRRSELARRQQADRQWKYLPAAISLSGKRALVLGMGYLGEPVAALLRDLGLHVTGWSRTTRAVRGICGIAGREALANALPDTDYLICLLPLTAATDHILDADLLGLLPARAFVINASRARCLDEAGLVRLLNKGALAGAVVDVLEQEPLPSDSALWSVPKLVITPHSAAVPAPEAYIPAIVEALRRVAGGAVPAHLIDRKRGY